MKKVNPELTKNFLNEIKNQESKTLDIDGVKIKTCRNVFPPQSKFSHSSIELHHMFGDLKGKRILDIGTGTGIQAIRSARMGAKYVLATDINIESVDCAIRNVKLNNAGEVVKIIESDLFDRVSKEKFDLIIANLPITDFPVSGIIESALYDAGYEIHRRFFMNVKEYLNADGAIIMTHINFKGDGDFEEFEKMIADYRYKVIRYEEIDAIGYKWRYYRIGIR